MPVGTLMFTQQGGWASAPPTGGPSWVLMLSHLRASEPRHKYQESKPQMVRLFCL